MYDFGADTLSPRLALVLDQALRNSGVCLCVCVYDFGAFLMTHTYIHTHIQNNQTQAHTKASNTHLLLGMTVPSMLSAVLSVSKSRPLSTLSI
jgi:hypothetical protein